ncbi:TPA: DUF2877 domain-containing protein [Vibrio parahaemolyticus]|nr:DUF2877 domain-containing protein [Vibrio parahaemolyticus]MDU9595513.1 DUF2877 domain-containing protein [Vibrio sp. 2-1-2a]MDU9604686.1 DUF2877 domain-containing protein [Vibrio sp. 1-2-3a]HCG6648584.1 DUF2877 domain-containing protein [Vibrio parahaemolyticus]
MMLFASEKGDLCPDQAFDGYIHSVFDKAINIISNDPTMPWVSLLDTSLPNTPCGLKVDILNQPEFRQCKVNDRVYFRGGILRFGAQSLLSIDSRSAVYWQQPPKPEEYQKNRILKNISYAENYFLSRVNNKLNNKHINSYIDYLKIEDIYFSFDLLSEPEKIVINIGKGQGLTPSGDDFICGVLAILTYLHKEADFVEKSVFTKVNKACQKRWGTTTEVSQHYLKQAVEGYFSQPVMWLVYEIFNSSSNSELEKTISNVLKIGSNSGCDIVSGILFGANQLKNNYIV